MATSTPGSATGLRTTRLLTTWGAARLTALGTTRCSARLRTTGCTARLGTGTHTAGHLSAWGHHAHAAHLSTGRAHATGHLTGTGATHWSTGSTHATGHLATRGTGTAHLSTRCAHATCHLTGARTTHWATRSATHLTARRTTHATHLHPGRVGARCAAGCHPTHLATWGTATRTTRCATHLLGGLLPGWGFGYLLQQQHLLLPTCGATHATRTTGPRASG